MQKFRSKSRSGFGGHHKLTHGSHDVADIPKHVLELSWAWAGPRDKSRI